MVILVVLLMGWLIFVWLFKYRGLLGFMNVGLGCYGSYLQLLGSVLFMRSLFRRPVQGILQLLIFIHLHLQRTTNNHRRFKERTFVKCVNLKDV